MKVFYSPTATWREFTRDFSPGPLRLFLFVACTLNAFLVNLAIYAGVKAVAGNLTGQAAVFLMAVLFVSLITATGGNKR